MDRIVTDPLLAALGEIIEETLVRGDSVHIQGLGTFTVKHRPSTLQPLDSGDLEVRPPADVIAFSPDA